MSAEIVARMPERVEAPAIMQRSSSFIGMPSKPAKGLVLVIGGDDDHQIDPCDAYVSTALRAAGFATLALDLSNGSEASDRAEERDISRLADRLASTVEASRQFDQVRTLPLGLFGTGVGTAAAFVAAERLGLPIDAVVSCGGRLDLAGTGPAVATVPTLLIVGRAGRGRLASKGVTQRHLGGRSRLEVVPGAFDALDTLDIMVELALRWFRIHLRHPDRSRSRAVSEARNG